MTYAHTWYHSNNYNNNNNNIDMDIDKHNLTMSSGEYYRMYHRHEWYHWNNVLKVLVFLLKTNNI